MLLASLSACSRSVSGGDAAAERSAPNRVADFNSGYTVYRPNTDTTGNHLKLQEFRAYWKNQQDSVQRSYNRSVPNSTAATGN